MDTFWPQPQQKFHFFNRERSDDAWWPNLEVSVWITGEGSGEWLDKWTIFQKCQNQLKSVRDLAGKVKQLDGCQATHEIDKVSWISSWKTHQVHSQMWGGVSDNWTHWSSWFTDWGLRRSMIWALLATYGLTSTCWAPTLLRHSYANSLNSNKTRHNEIIWIRCKAGKLYALRWKRLVIRSLIKSFHFPQPRFKVRRIFIKMWIQWRSIYRGAIWKPSGLSILCPANLDVCKKKLQNIVETMHLMMDIVHP